LSRRKTEINKTIKQKIKPANYQSGLFSQVVGECPRGKSTENTKTQGTVNKEQGRNQK